MNLPKKVSDDLYIYTLKIRNSQIQYVLVLVYIFLTIIFGVELSLNFSKMADKKMCACVCRIDRHRGIVYKGSK
jgi:hypothetical protein